MSKIGHYRQTLIIMTAELKTLIHEYNHSDADLVIRELRKSELNSRTEIAQTRYEFIAKATFIN